MSTTPITPGSRVKDRFSGQAGTVQAIQPGVAAVVAFDGELAAEQVSLDQIEFLTNFPAVVNIGDQLIWLRPDGKHEVGTVGIGQGGRPVFASVEHSQPVFISVDTAGVFIPADLDPDDLELVEQCFALHGDLTPRYRRLARLDKEES